MMGKMNIGALVFLGALLVAFFGLSYSAFSAEQQTGTTTMNVTVRGYVSISASACVTNGITFNSTDPATSGNNATCNSGYWGGGTGYNLSRDTSSTANINFTHATNRTNLTDGTNTFDIGNVTTHSNSTANDGVNVWNNATATSLSNSWLGMETCGNLGSSTPDCWSTYFLDVPAAQAPGDYKTGYCWCGRRQGTPQANCGTCT